MSEINQLTTANTFSQWLTGTQELISKVNSLTDGGNAIVFYANTNLEIGNNVTIGGDLTVTGNIILDDIGFDDLYVNGNVSIANTLAVTGETTLSDVIVTGNVATLNVTNKVEIGDNANLYGDLYVGGNTVFGGSVTLDVVGFNDLDVSGNANIGGTFAVTGDSTIGGTLDVTGNSTFTNANVTGTLTASLAEITTANIINANVSTLVGSANSAIYQRIEDAEGTALAFSIALG